MKKTNDSPKESTEQMRFVSWFNKTQERKIIMVRNDGTRTPIEKANQNAMGLYKGVSDLLVPDGMIWIEMKRIKGSTWPQEQKAWKAYVESLGQTYLLCYGCEDAKAKYLDIINL
jgi:hypothetical protein